MKKILLVTALLACSGIALAESNPTYYTIWLSAPTYGSTPGSEIKPPFYVYTYVQTYYQNGVSTKESVSSQTLTIENDGQYHARPIPITASDNGGAIHFVRVEAKDATGKLTTIWKTTTTSCGNEHDQGNYFHFQANSIGDKMRCNVETITD